MPFYVYVYAVFSSLAWQKLANGCLNLLIEILAVCMCVFLYMLIVSFICILFSLLVCKKLCTWTQRVSNFSSIFSNRLSFFCSSFSILTVRFKFDSPSSVRYLELHPAPEFFLFKSSILKIYKTCNIFY